MAEFAAPLLTVGATLFSANAQRQASKFNVAALQQEQGFQQQRTALEADRFGREAARRRATQQAIASKAGRSLTEGSVVDLLAEQAREDELDAAIIRMGGDITQSRLRSEQQKERIAGRTQPFSTLLSGGARAASLLPA